MRSALHDWETAAIQFVAGLLSVKRSLNLRMMHDIEDADFGLWAASGSQQVHLLTPGVLSWDEDDSAWAFCLEKRSLTLCFLFFLLAMVGSDKDIEETAESLAYLSHNYWNVIITN